MHLLVKRILNEINLSWLLKPQVWNFFSMVDIQHGTVQEELIFVSVWRNDFVSSSFMSAVNELQNCFVEMERFMAQWWTGKDGELELTKNSTNCVVRMTVWNSASWVDWDGQDMSYGRMTTIYPGESSSASQEEMAPEGGPCCVGKMKWRKM